eukprot:6202980-Pleurochrysis_carterae.AAC.1
MVAGGHAPSGASGASGDRLGRGVARRAHAQALGQRARRDGRNAPRAGTGAHALAHTRRGAGGLHGPRWLAHFARGTLRSSPVALYDPDAS